VKIVIPGKDKRDIASQTIYISHPGVGGRQFNDSLLGQTIVAVPAELK
jgi:hypothetical protein